MLFFLAYVRNFVYLCTQKGMMLSPFVLPPSADAQEAARKVIERVHAYMRVHPESELHRCGKMFGVLIYEGGYLAAFSAKLDGSYEHEGFVPPVWEGLEDERIRGLVENPIGHSKEESRRLQKLLFANYNFVNGKGETKNLLEIFKDEKVVSPDDWFNKSQITTALPIDRNHKSQMCASAHFYLTCCGATKENHPVATTAEEWLTYLRRWAKHLR